MDPGAAAHDLVPLLLPMMTAIQVPDVDRAPSLVDVPAHLQDQARGTVIPATSAQEVRAPNRVDALAHLPVLHQEHTMILET